MIIHFQSRLNVSYDLGSHDKRHPREYDYWKRELSWCQLFCRYWWHQRLLLCQPPMPPMATMLVSWQLSVFIDLTGTGITPTLWTILARVSFQYPIRRLIGRFRIWVSNTRDLVLNVHIALKFDRRIASMLSSRLSNFWAIGRPKTPMSHLRYFARCIRRLMSNRNNYLIPAQFWSTQYRLFTCNKCYE